ncbi:MAG: ferredoxin [bacterium]|nr:ferredoxin [bacterium]
MKIRLDREKCIGCGSCVAICPKYFEMDPNGRAKLIKKLTISSIECIQNAVDCCPSQAIRIE